MKEILLTSSVLILALLALRQLFRRTVSRRMQYALWLLVLVRLLVPVNVGTLAHNVLSAAEPVQAAVEKRLETPILYTQDGTERRPAQLLPGKESQGDPQSPPSDAAQSAPADEYSIVTPTYRTVTLSEALTYVWYAGMAGVGAWFLFTNLRFARAAQGAHTLPRRGLPLSGLSRVGAALAVPVRCAAPRRLPERKGAAKPRRPALCARARADPRAAP